MGMLTGVGMQREYERNWFKTKMVAIELDCDGIVLKINFIQSLSPLCHPF